MGKDGDFLAFAARSLSDRYFFAGTSPHVQWLRQVPVCLGLYEGRGKLTKLVALFQRFMLALCLVTNKYIPQLFFYW